MWCFFGTKIWLVQVSKVFWGLVAQLGNLIVFLIYRFIVAQSILVVARVSELPLSELYMYIMLPIWASSNQNNFHFSCPRCSTGCMWACDFLSHVVVNYLICLTGVETGQVTDLTSVGLHKPYLSPNPSLTACPSRPIQSHQGVTSWSVLFIPSIFFQSISVQNGLTASLPNGPLLVIQNALIYWPTINKSGRRIPCPPFSILLVLRSQETLVLRILLVPVLL
jgi:hypothetical protein